MTDHPQKPQLTLRVGITGHRPNKLSNADRPRIEQQLRDTFATIEAAVAKTYAANSEVYASAAAAGSKPYRIRLISGFAEGADQLATAICPADWTVEAILPFPKDEYLKDFETSASGDGRDVRDEFLKSLARASVVTQLPTPEVRNHGYVLCGNFLLRQIDVLVAVWDGEEPKLGGTGAIAQEACDGGIPVVWIATGNHPTALIESFNDGKPVRAKDAWGAQALQQSLDPILAAPSADAFGQRSQRQRLEQFYAETWPGPTRASSFDLLKRWTTGQRPLRLTIPTEPRAAMAARFSQFVEEAPAAGTLSERLKDVLAPRHAWADALAVQFSHLYRNAYVLAYLLAAAAVLIAVSGAYVEHAILKFMLVALELGVVISIIQLVRYGGRNAWHERWIDYRLVAESLRYARFLAYVSEFGLVNRKDLTGQPWTIWYIRATLREVGLPNAVLDRAYQRPLLQSVLRSEVREQRHWHETNTDAMAKVDHFLHHAAERSFLYTFGALCLSLVALAFIIVLLPEAQEHHVLVLMKPWLLLFAAGLPALGAALAGIRVQGEFEDSMERSEHMIAELNALEATYETQLRQQPQLERTGEILIETARVLSEDLAAWQELYGRKRLNLPA